MIPVLSEEQLQELEAIEAYVAKQDVLTDADAMVLLASVNGIDGLADWYRRNETRSLDETIYVPLSRLNAA